MLLEVNRLRYVVLDRPPEAGVDRWARICDAVKTCILVPEASASWWRKRLPPSAVVHNFNESYLTEVSGNIRDTLDALGAEPHEALYVTFRASDVDEAISTRIGTALVNEGVGQTLPDLFFPDSEKLETAIMDLVKGRAHGYIVELFSLRYGGGSSPDATGYIGIQPYLKGREHLNSDVVDQLDIIIGGRYFPETESRHAKHQPSLRLLHAKHGDRRGNPLMPAFGDVLDLAIKNRTGIEVVTRVPPKPSKAADYLGAFLLASAKDADKRRGCALHPLVYLDALRCVREYGQQRKAGHYGKRAENVRGAFAATSRIVKGKDVALVDDILTSGATMAEAAETLLDAGAKSVIACPIAITQNSVNYDSAYELPCPAPRCSGTMRIRFASKTDGAFWGCDQWKPSGGCNEMMPFRDGLRAANRLTQRSSIVVWDWATF